MTEFLSQYHVAGLVIGLSTFLIIGIFHPLVIKAEYYFGVRSWRWFLMAGILFLAAAIFVHDLVGSCLLGVTGFSSFWSIGEIIQQQERVRKGWFPRNPKRTYPWDKDEETPVATHDVHSDKAERFGTSRKFSDKKTRQRSRVKV